MGSLGKWLLFFGIGSAVLHSFGYEFRLLMWIDHWGEQMGWVIRIGLMLVGAGLWGASSFGNKGDPSPTA